MNTFFQNVRCVQQKGAAALLSVSLLALLTLSIGIGILAIAGSENTVSGDSYDAGKALVYAEAGAREALIRIARNKGYSCTAPALPTGCFSVEFETGGCAVNQGCARVTVSTGSGASVLPKIVDAEGYAGRAIRKIRVEVLYDPSLRGEIASTTWREI